MTFVLKNLTAIGVDYCQFVSLKFFLREKLRIQNKIHFQTYYPSCHIFFKTAL